MIWKVRATFERGKFVPKGQCDIPEGAECDLEVHGPVMHAPLIADPAERRRILAQLVERMRSNAVAGDWRPFTRDELHERG